MGKFKNFLMAGAFTGLMAFLPSCERNPDNPPDDPDDKTELPEFKNVSEKIIKSNLQFPSGLSSNKGSIKSGLKSSKGISAEADGIFMEAPLYVNNRGAKGIEPYRNPTISEFSGTLENVSTTSLAEIDLDTYPSDFDSPAYYPLADSLWRAHGITLDGLVLNDGTILSSSNSSDKIFKRNSSGEIELFLQNNNLERITDMIQGSDGKIYAAQAPLFDNNSALIYPKRVISIENGIIKTEFELPSAINPNFSMNLEDLVSDWWKDGSLIHRLKIIENSIEGKKKFGTEFYVADLLEDVIYKVDAEKKVSVLARDLKFPSSLAVDSLGYLFYTTMPLSKGEITNLTHKVSLNVLDPETGEHSSIHEFNESVSDYASYGGRAYLMYNGVKYTTSVGFNITNVLYESKDKLEFLITNSLQGTLKSLTLEK